MSKPLEIYTNRIADLTSELQKLLRKTRWFGTLRLLTFLAIPTLFLVFSFSTLTFVLSFLLLVLFLFLVKVHIDFQRKTKHKKILLKYYTNEKESLEKWDFTRFDGGTQYDQPGHPYAKDLGLFGNHSVFQMISRAHESIGQAWLANEVKNIPATRTEILLQQESVKELSSLQGFKEAFLIYSQENKITDSQFEGIQQWFKNNYNTSQLQKLKIVGIVQSILFIAITGLTVWGPFSPVFYMLPFATMGIFLQPHFKRLNMLLAQSDGIATFLQQLMRLFQLIENTPFSSELLKTKQAELKKNHAASAEIKQLFKAFKQLEYRQNVIVGILLNLSCLWDAWSLLRIEQLKERFHAVFQDWVDVVSFFDAMNSKAQFAFNHPEANFPEIAAERGILMNAVNARHPIIAPQKSVPNSFEIMQQGEIKLITGANMAGKSTFLRTVGVTHILASMGMPVFCTSFNIKPMRLYTSMLTVDDLSEEKSYFLAEVERLAQMVKYIHQHPDTLLIMDEILKGTNSHDKEEGSRLFIEKLISIGATGIIATHDLNLTNMENKFPNKIENLSFEVEQVGDEMHFDYTLRKGATKTMNAMQLLQNKGLIEFQA